MIPFNYHHLYYFFIIAKAGSISKACEQLRLAQPTISTQLKQFETSLGRPLFERRQQRLYLTEEGRTVLAYAESIFELGRELQATLQDRPAGGRRTIQLGVLQGAPRAFAFALVRQVLEDEPMAHVVVQEGPLDRLLAELRQQQLDLILTDVSVPSAAQGELTNVVIGTVPIVFAAAPRVARQYSRFPRSLNGAPVILPRAPSQIYQQIQEFFAVRQLTPRVVAEVEGVELARRLAIAGFGIAPLNAYTVSVSEPKGALTVLGRSQTIHQILYLVARKRKRPNPLAEHLVKTFRIPPQAARRLNGSKRSKSAT